MKILFLYNAQDHHLPHSLPIACALSRLHPEHEVTALLRDETRLQLARGLAEAYPGHRLRFEVLAPSPLPGRLGRGKFAVLLRNRRRLDDCDAIVVPERTSIVLRRLGVRRPRLIHSFHGPSGHDRADDPRLRRFDLLLAPSQRRLDRIAAAGNLRPGHAAVVGSAKLDLVRRLGTGRARLFPNDRPVVLYNPHHRGVTSSWPLLGRAVLDHFAGRDDLNLVFAPHLRAFDPPGAHEHLFRRYHGLDHVRIDLGSRASIDMTYSAAADLYLGDISSQVIEFVAQPRPCLFLNPRDLPWRDDPDFSSWRLGPVVRDVAEMAARLADVPLWAPGFEAAQRLAAAQAFGDPDLPGAEPAPERAAHAIHGFLRRGRLDERLDVPWLAAAPAARLLDGPLEQSAP